MASQQLLKQNAPAIGEVAQVIGLLVSSLPAVQYGPLFYRSIEIDKNMAVQQHKGNYSLFSHDVTRYPYLGVRHYGAPRQRNLMQISSHFYSSSHESCNTFRFDQDISQENCNEDLDSLSKDIPVLSEYAKGLETHVKRRYLQKISLVGVDPASIPSDQFDPECLPSIEATDLVSYLVLEASYYTKQQFKCHKSLEAYNQMASGFVTSVQGKIIAGKHAVVGKVRHSQRMNDPLVNIWVITESDGTILAAHYLGCKAGLTESCSHIASVLFYIEAWIHINGKLACTQVKCSWLLPTYVNEVSYERVKDRFSVL